MSAARTVAEELASIPAQLPPAETFGAVRSIREGSGVQAVTIVEGSGEISAWDGEHKGPFPGDLTPGTVSFVEGPLFSYLYVTEPRAESAGIGVAAVLLDSDLPPELGSDLGDFAARFRARTGERVEFRDPAGALRTEGVGFPTDEARLMTALIQAPDVSEVRDQVLGETSIALVVILLLTWLVLAWQSARGGHGTLWAAVSLVGIAAAVPWQEVLRLGPLFLPGTFVLPGPFSQPLGQILAITSAVIVAAGLRGWLDHRPGGRGSGSRRDAGPVLAVVVVGAAFPGILAILLRAGSYGLLAGSEVAWIGFQWTAAALLALISGAALWTVRAPDPGSRGVPGLPLLGLAPILGLGAALLVVGVVTLTLEVPIVLAVVWAVPVGVLAIGVGVPRMQPLGSGGLWLLTILIAASAALPFSWGARVASRARIAEVELAELESSNSTPVLGFLLGRYAEAAMMHDRAGEGTVELLYRAWRESGLPEEGHPLWVELWGPAGEPLREVRFGGVTPLGDAAETLVRDAAASMAAEARSTDEFQIGRGVGGATQYLAAVPLLGGRVVTVAAFARRSLAPPSPLGSLLALSGRDAGDPLTLVPLLPSDLPAPRDSVSWARGADGWQAARAIDYPEGTYNALYALSLPGPLLRVARGTLIVALDVALFLILWGMGRFIALGRGGLPGWRPQVATSFRARISAALFGFFLISIVIFATLAFRTLSAAGERTAIALAENVVENVARSYPSLEGPMIALARDLGGHLLEYKEGMLAEASEEAEELIELGLYEAWVPPEIYLPLSTQTSLLGTAVVSLGTSEYVLAYRRLPDGDVVATPVSLEAGDAALRRREAADLLFFAVLVGGALSLGLAILVGRAFARPIQTLQVASERVGSGNLDVRLADERGDEFGSVFLAFNRMVESLDRARRDLLRTSRRTRAIVEEAATGVVAVDSNGHLTLVNPRAERMLGCTLQPGERIGVETPEARDFAHWVDLYFRQSILEATTELQAGVRRIRVRGRRIGGKGSGEGAVFSLEDMTDELRSERILAWGEMARQVAHEVKNPLTPIRLSVQHVHRAWEDRRPEFGEILTRNVDAILREIDRLASIATSFSRFGAPGEAGETPIEEVDLGPLVEETLALYSGGDGPISFTFGVEGEPPRVCTRPGEFKEVLVNLLENARSAVGDAGTIQVRAAFVEGDERVLLEVADDGDGIDPEVLPRIFEPHFSTRSAGTGLGLAIVRRLVESWGGSVEADSLPGEGTSIRMHLRTEPASETGEDEDVVPPGATPGGLGPLFEESGGPDGPTPD